jgi:hypothetical protein
MKLEQRNVARPARAEDFFTPHRAELISRLWQAIAFVHEIRNDLGTNVRVSASRDSAADKIASATRDLADAAALLAPTRAV